MLDKFEWIANHILTRIFGLALIAGSSFALYEEVITQWPAIGMIVFGVFCAVPTKVKDFMDLLQSDINLVKKLLGR